MAIVVIPINHPMKSREGVGWMGVGWEGVERE